MAEDKYPRRVYLLSPRDLSPETIAVTFAKTSRSPQSFDEIAAELTDEKSAQFHEKWVVGYGHASVAEHAVLHVAFENVSRLAIETIESNRLASYTEKSTRYQRWQPDGFHVPAEVRGSEHEATLRSTCQALFDAYQASLEPVRRVVQERNPRREGESEAAWDGRLRARYVDVCRFFLPAAALANVGMTANARTLEHAIRKMLSHPLDEVRRLGEETRAAAQAEVPTLLKYADPAPYAREAEARLAREAEGIADVPSEAVRLAAWDAQGETRVLAAAMYANGQGSWMEMMSRVEAKTPEERRRLADALLADRGPHDVPLRALEHTSYVFEIVIDQGGYFELKRHRIMTQTPQRLTARLGYAVPRLIVDAGLEGAYRGSMDRAREAYETLAEWNSEVAAYVVPNGFRRRVLISANLREIFHLCELRSAANAHFSIRRIALLIAEAVRQVHPALGSFLRLPEGVGWKSLEAEHFLEA
ncbi:MAG TPA: FAD-dependent thymidylate synthase [Anaerolineales bacterium]|nr:FAD-dependent thymidylate synthase [Anaerolineales bacterium]